jgi:ribokinase
VSDELLSDVDLLVVNETEAEAIGGADRAALLKKVPAAVVTLGAAGAVILTRGDDEIAVPGVPVDVVDTTAAGTRSAACWRQPWLPRQTTGAITASDLTNAVRRAKRCCYH